MLFCGVALPLLSTTLPSPSISLTPPLLLRDLGLLTMALRLRRLRLLTTAFWLQGPRLLTTAL
jgi:hypothetical protein